MLIEIVTPHGSVFRTEADEIIAPGVLGELGLLGGHIPVISALKTGLMTITAGGTTHRFAIEGGFLELANDKVNIITERAMRPSEIDLELVAEQRTRAEETMSQGDSGPEAQKRFNDELLRADVLTDIAKLSDS